MAEIHRPCCFSTDRCGVEFLSLKPALAANGHADAIERPVMGVTNEGEAVLECAPTGCRSIPEAKHEEAYWHRVED